MSLALVQPLKRNGGVCGGVLGSMQSLVALQPRVWRWSLLRRQRQHDYVVSDHPKAACILELPSPCGTNACNFWEPYQCVLSALKHSNPGCAEVKTAQVLPGQTPHNLDCQDFGALWLRQGQPK